MTQSQVRIGWRKYVDLGLDASATTFITAAGLTDETQKSAINTLVKDLKRFNLWSKIKAFYPFVGGSATSHKFNLIDPRDTNDAYRLTFSGGWTHDTMGIKGNNSNTVANTNLSLKTVFGSTSSEHSLGIYINENPVGMSYRSDIGAADGGFNFGAGTQSGIIGLFNTNTIVYAADIPSDQWLSFNFSSPTSVLGLTELKRYKSNYALNSINGVEIYNRRTTTTTNLYNPINKVTIGNVAATNWSAFSTNRYSSAYIAGALSSLESYMMYVAIQRFNTVLNRQVGTAINTILNSYTSTEPTLITNGLKLRLETSSLTIPTEGALSGTYPGSYFKNNDIWLDSSGNGNNGTFVLPSGMVGDGRTAEYFISDDKNVPEIRFRSVDNTNARLYQPGYQADALTTNYKGSDTGIFTFGGWVKVNTKHNEFWLTRGNDTLGGGWAFILGGSLNGTVSLNYVSNGGGTATNTKSATTTLQADIWYNVYCIWKPSNYIKIYINGVLDSSKSITMTGVRSSNTGFGINSNVLGNTYGHGKSIVGAYHVYDRELSEAEILQNFEATRRKYNV
jgi:hypothetical protein